MHNLICQFSTLSISEDMISTPESLRNKDTRADSSARVAVLAATNQLKDINNLDLTSLNVLVINREGCTSHIKKVTTNIRKCQPAQGFFVRGGPQTLATYTALAIGSHGATFTFVGNQDTLADAISTAFYMANRSERSSTLLTVVVKNQDAGYQTNTVIIQHKNCQIPATLLEQEAYAHLSKAFN